MFSQNDPYVMERIFDHTVTMETKARMTFLERYEGFCIDLIKVADRALGADVRRIRTGSGLAPDFYLTLGLNCRGGSLRPWGDRGARTE